jgi:5'-nucleotidase
MMAFLGALPVKPDIVVSGINHGANLGTDIVYSGTAAAARQGSLCGLPSLALSLVGDGLLYWEPAVSFVVEHFEEWIAPLLGQSKTDIFINVNIPNTPEGPSGICTTFPSRRLYQDRVSIFDAPDGRRYCFLHAGAVGVEPETGSDEDAVARNLVSVSPVFVHPVVSREFCPHAPDHTAVSPRPSKK